MMFRQTLLGLTPAADEQRENSRDICDRLEVDPLVDGVEPSAGRPVANGLPGLEEAQVRGRAGGLRYEHTSPHLLVTLREQADERRIRLEGIATRAKAAELDLRVAVGAFDGCGEERLCLARIHPDRETETHVELGSSWRHRRPVPCVQRADVEQVGTLHTGELRLNLLVQRGFELVESRGDGEGRLDRIRALVGVRSVARTPF